MKTINCDQDRLELSTSVLLTLTTTVKFYNKLLIAFSGQFHGESQETDTEVVIPNSNAFVDATGDLHPGKKNS